MVDVGAFKLTRPRKPAQAPQKVMPDAMGRENEMLRSQLAALRVERDFWVEQARGLQNHLQTVMRGQASILEQMARGPIAESDVLAITGRIAQELRQPLTSVEAVRALTATVSGAQGVYTPVSAADKRLLNEQSEYCRNLEGRSKK